MARVNSEAKPASEDELTVTKFWTDTYLPFVEANKKHSTTHSYKQIWGQHLSTHFGGRTLSEYRTSDAYKFLNGLDSLPRFAFGIAIFRCRTASVDQGLCIPFLILRGG